MKSIFNFRPLFVIFLGSICGVIYYIAITNFKNWLGLFIVFSALIFILLLYIILGALNRKNKFLKYLNKTYKCCIVFLVSLFIFGGIFSGACYIKNNSLVNIKEEVEYKGKICAVKNESNYAILELRNVTYNNRTSTKKLKSHLKVYVYTINQDNLKVGNVITTTGEISKQEIKSYAYYNYSALYTSKTSLNKLKIENGKPNFIESVKLKTKTLLNKHISNENANIAYSMLFGEKEDLDKNVINIFSIAGISHILAVSGLHIGVLVALVLFLLNKIKINNIAKFLILAFILLLYATFCNFTPSVVRASIMALVLALSNNLGKKYDALSSLNFAGLIITVFNPFALFSVGFQLSFACVFAIITLSPFISRCLQKIKLNKKFADTLAISTATSIALIPFCAYYFNRISLLSVVTNIIVIPIFSVTYIILFLVTIISLIFNFASYLYIIPNVLIHFIKLIANFVANLKFSYLVVFNVSAVSFVSILLLEYFLQFMVGLPKLKIVLVVLLLSIFVVDLIFNCKPITYNSNNIFCFKQYYGNMVVTSTNNNNLTVIGLNENDYSRLKGTMIKLKVKNVTNLVLYENVKNVDFINNIVKEYNIKNVYMPKIYFKTTIKNVKMINDDDNFYIGQVKYNYVVNDNKIYGVNIFRNNLNNFFGLELTKQEVLEVSLILNNNVNIFCVNNLNFNLNSLLDCNLIISQNNYKYDGLKIDISEKEFYKAQF